MNKPLSLVKYAGEYWFPLASYTMTRDAEGYSDHASVKSAIRTYVVKTEPDTYIAFRGENQLKNIIQENRNNPLFNAEEFQGTRTALIQLSMLDKLNERFNIDRAQTEDFLAWVAATESYIEKETEKHSNIDTDSDAVENTGTRSGIVRQLRLELSRLDKNIDILKRNREKIMQALNAVEGLEFEDLV